MRANLLRTAAAAFAVFLSSPTWCSVARAQPPGFVRIEGRQLLRDGRPWTPHGFYQIPFEVPPASFPAQKNAFWQQAYDDFSPAEYAEMRRQGADSVRLQIAQDGANPLNRKFYAPRWFGRAVGAIRAARAAGLVVIVGIQDEIQTGVPRKAPLPNGGTRLVWHILAPIFAHDRGVLYELYNEPQSPGAAFDPHQRPTAAQWQGWAEAMNRTLAVVRASGAVNVVVADGLQSAQQLSGAPELADPLHQVLYASHPYLNDANDETPAAWDQKFGDFARSHPVIVSEWVDDYFCDTNNPVAVTNFLRYLAARGVGLEIGIWDFAPHTFHSVVQGFPQGQFSSFLDESGAPRACTAPNYGPGKDVESWYLGGTPPASPR